MQEVIITTTSRKLVGHKASELRGNGQVPGVVYGQGKEAAPIQVDDKQLGKVYHLAGTSKLVELKIDDAAPINVLFQDVQIDPVSQRMVHFDLYKVKMDEKIKTEVPLHFTGEAPAVHEQNAILVKNLEELEIETLPGNLPENIEVNLDSLTEIGNSIAVADLQIPAGVTILTDKDEMIVKTDPPRSEEELEELDEAVEEGAEAEVESEHGGETEESEEAEGEKKPEAEAPAKDEKTEEAKEK